MAITKYNPNNLIEAFFSDPFFNDGLSANLTDRLSRRNFVAPTNISRSKTELTFEMSVPGFSRADLDITTEGNTLTITGQSENTDREFARQEFFTTKFSRSFTLPQGADTENIAARYENGILTVAVNLENIQRSRKIDIQ
ncbi:MAG: Hsp20/alpha crystallin family protein [Chlamydiota bacterium]|jgi:HSP20 family protein|nr:Hsp20/alpha crystallin family protein [Chlamydiota bacterium]